MKIAFTFERETKNTYRFAEDIVDDRAPVIGTLYIQKAAFEFIQPQNIVVTVEVKA